MLEHLANDLPLAIITLPKGALTINENDPLVSCAEAAVTYLALGPQVFAETVAGSSPPTPVEGRRELGRFSLMVMSNAMAGQEGTYGTWYENQHVPDVLRIPGFLSSQRYILNRVERGSVNLPRYMLIRFRKLRSGSHNC